MAARDKEVYGEDSEIFKPERWLDADEKGLKAMERNFLAVSLRVAILTISVAIHATLADVKFLCSSVLVHERAWGRTSRFWRSANWFLRFCGISISRCPRRRTGSCMTIGSSDRLA